MPCKVAHHSQLSAPAPSNCRCTSRWSIWDDATAGSSCSIIAQWSQSSCVKCEMSPPPRRCGSTRRRNTGTAAKGGECRSGNKPHSHRQAEQMREALSVGGLGEGPTHHHREV